LESGAAPILEVEMSSMKVDRFKDRTEAGRMLAQRLRGLTGDVVVLGIPRGGVPVAAEVARVLNAPLDVAVARKLGAPNFPELAIGAVTPNGGRYVDDDIMRELRVSPAYLEAVTAQEREEARRREERFRAGAAPEPLGGRTVVLVDDGLATGSTMRAAVRSVRLHLPARLIVAVPVGSQQACEALVAEADEVICLASPEPFYAVGLYYQAFEATPDDTVTDLLRQARAERAAQRSAAPPVKE
jgi:predicted phosphoribosyltransferase